MIATISKVFDFDAAHHLPFVPVGHKCNRLHGHTYRAEIRLTGEINGHGMVVDYAEIAKVWEPLHDALDHRYLNQLPGLENPTTEILVHWLLDRLKGAFPELGLTVRVYESATTWCEVSR